MARGDSCFRNLEKFSEDLIKEGMITAEQLAVAQVSQENLGEDLGSILIKRQFTNEHDLLDFYARHIKVPFINLKDLIIEPRVVRDVPLPIDRRYKLIPFKKTGDKLFVAMANPKDKASLEELHAVVHCNIEPHLASVEDIDAAIQSYYQLASAKSVSENELEEDIEIVYKNEEESWSDEQFDEIQKIASGGKIVSKVSSILYQAYQENASDVHIEPTREFLRVRYRVDGLLEEKNIMPMQSHLPITSRIKIL